MLPEEVYQAAQTRAMDCAAMEQHGIQGIVLMRRAGEAAFKRIMTRHSGITQLLVVCGAGNNGGDGYVVAACARRMGLVVTVLAAAEPNTADAATARQDYLDNGGAISGDHAVFARADWAVDALLGTGLSRAPQGVYAELIRRMNAAECPVAALDMPSGLHSDTGFAFTPCVVASVTITFVGVKVGLLTGQGRSHAGDIVFEDLRLPLEARRLVEPSARIIQPPALAKRRLEMHKGDAGRILIVGGDDGMLGATLLAGEAALRCGSGLATVASAAAHLALPALRCPELMSADALRIPVDRISALADVVVLGPGLGQSAWSERVFKRFIQCDRPMVVDADGLNWLARAGSSSGQRNWALTPHPGEAARLLGCSSADIQADRPGAAGEIVARFGGVCILKGAGTLVAGVAETLRVCDRGNPGMATAGMGDVLSGVVGSLLGQGASVFDAAAAAVWLHAGAADAAADELGERGLLARDAIAHLPRIIKQIEAP